MRGVLLAVLMGLLIWLGLMDMVLSMISHMAGI